MSHANEFIETSLFTRQIRVIATDDELKDLQSEFTESPDKSDLMPGIGGDRRNHCGLRIVGKLLFGSQNSTP